MKNKTIRTIIIVALLCTPVLAQRVEIFGGAQYEHLQSSYNAVGWNASVTGNFKHVLGITGDLSGVYNSHRASSSVYTYTVGPVLSARLPVVQPFVHALFGGVTASTAGVSENAFAMLVGGGLDIGFRKGYRVSASAGRLANDQVRSPNSGQAGKSVRGHCHQVLSRKRLFQEAAMKRRVDCYIYCE